MSVRTRPRHGYKPGGRRGRFRRAGLGHAELIDRSRRGTGDGCGDNVWNSRSRPRRDIGLGSVEPAHPTTEGVDDPVLDLGQFAGVVTLVDVPV